MCNIPSIYAHIVNGILILIALILFYNNYSALRNIDVYKKLLLTLVFSISIGVHGLSHLGLETVYNFNPMKQI
jgi:hypothetical protein